MSYWRMPWNRNIGPIGLDLGAEAPRLMQVRHGIDAPRQVAVVRCEPGDGLVQRAVAAAHAMRKGRFVGREVVVGLPSSFARMHVARLPVIAGADAREAVAWEAAERNGMARESIVADAIPTGAPAPHGDAKEEQLVVAAPADELEQALGVLVDAGFDPVAVEPRFMAIARAMSRRARRDADATNVRAVLHVEQHGSCIMVLRGDRIAFCREIPVGGETLDHAVASRLSVPIEAAAALRAHRIAAVRGMAPAVDAVAEESALAATRATIDALAGEVALCLRYYGVTFRGGQPGRVVVSGPHGAEPRLAEIVAETTRAEVVPFDRELPSAAAEGGEVRLGAGEFASWLAAYGLACRGRHDEAHAHGHGGSRGAKQGMHQHAPHAAQGRAAA
jgi:type IV pilus assembly protein PilM